jgi:hypothetical protein
MRNGEFGLRERRLPHSFADIQWLDYWKDASMRPDEIRAHLHKHPFVPIRVFLSDGSHYDVYHRDFMLVSRAEVVIGLNAGADELPERNAYLDPVHITRIEPVNGNRMRGRPRRSKG